MFLPIGDAPNPKGVPIVTYALIAANVAAFLLLNVPLDSRRADVRSPEFREYVGVMARELEGRVDVRQLVAQTSADDVFSFEHGYRPASPQLPDLFSCMFLHGSFMHLFGNMLFLWIYGDNVERRLGLLRLPLVVPRDGVAATLTHALMFSSSRCRSSGRRGDLGVLGFYFVWFPRNVVRCSRSCRRSCCRCSRFRRAVLGHVPRDRQPAADLRFRRAEWRTARTSAASWREVWWRGSWTAGTQAQPVRFPRNPSASGAEVLRLALTSGRHAEAAEAYFALPRPTRAACSRPTRPCRSPGWLGRTATPTRRSRCCGASCATFRRAAVSPRSTPPWESSCWRTCASRRPRTSTC